MDTVVFACCSQVRVRRINPTVVGPDFVAVAVHGRAWLGSECLPDLLHGHDITDPATQGQQGDHEGEQQHAHGLDDTAWGWKVPASGPPRPQIEP